MPFVGAFWPFSSCHFLSFPVISCHFLSFPVISCRPTSCHFLSVISCRWVRTSKHYKTRGLVISCHFLSPNFLSFPVISCHFLSFSVISCHPHFLSFPVTFCLCLVGRGGAGTQTRTTADPLKRWLWGMWCSCWPTCTHRHAHRRGPKASAHSCAHQASRSSRSTQGRTSQPHCLSFLPKGGHT